MDDTSTGRALALLGDTISLTTYIRSAESPQSIITATEQITTLCSHAPDAFIANPKLLARRLHPDDKESALSAFAELDQGESYTCEYRWQTASEGYQWFCDTGRFVQGTDDTPDRIVCAWQLMSVATN